MSQRDQDTRALRRSYYQRHAAVTALVLGALAPCVHGACLPLVDTTLASLEAEAERSPRDGYLQAQQPLADSRVDAAPLRKASILSILSAASVALSRPEDVRHAVSDALEIVGKISQTSDRDSAAIARIRTRLLLDEVLLAITPEEHRAAIVELDKLLASSPQMSAESACALIARSQKYSDLRDQERSASDALSAYRISVKGDFVDARSTMTRSE